ncbi:MAG: hypothetical protein FJW27_01970 [Acidimicrobiia bacterium]|nr:hypothetical protein [Acidimicrobiia bacterium]
MRVDAGRNSPTWLDGWGFGRPDTRTVKVDVGYATAVFERRPGDFFSSMGGIIAGTPPLSRRYGAVLAAEGSRWVSTLGDYPPTDPPAWRAYAASLPVSAVHDLVAGVEPMGPITTYRFPANQRRLYERMARFPNGYVVIGDAVCSFNPIYGQGMSTAAMEAKAIEETLAAGVDGLAARFYRCARRIVDIPWTIATGEDLRYPEVEGTRPPGSALLNRYLNRVHAVASEDAIVCRKFFDVLNLLAPPPTLLSPAVAWRVLARRVPAGAGTPWGLAPPAVPSTV